MIAVEHLELAVQATSRLRLSREAVVSGDSRATAQPASMTIAAAAVANFKVFQFADDPCRECTMSSLLTDDAVLARSAAIETDLMFDAPCYLVFDYRIRGPVSLVPRQYSERPSKISLSNIMNGGLSVAR